MLNRLIYKSLSTISHEQTQTELDAIAAACARNNPRWNVTGAIVHHRGTFVQMLEGGRGALTDTLKRLLNDSRHTDVELLAFGETPRRRFAQFSMQVLELDEWMAVEMANFAVGDTFDLNALSADSLEALLVALGDAAAERARMECARATGPHI